LPAGPHIILTVPLNLMSLPPEIDQYKVDCNVMGPNGGVSGKGFATGVIGRATNASNTGVDFKSDVQVEVFVTGTAATLKSVVQYSCRLSLQGTAGGVTTNYLMAGPTGDAVATNCIYGEAKFPLATGAPCKNRNHGPVSN
jgi:hypothetical protein